MTVIQNDDLTILEMLEEHEIPCDYHGDLGYNDAPASWVMFKVCPICDERGAKLVCEDCKSIRMSADAGVYCNPGCGEIVAPARHMYTRVEPL